MTEQSEEKPEVLVVDDSKVIRLAAKKMLGTDYVIHLAEDGLVGWEMVQKKPAISVVFTDLSMPNLDGMELLKNIRGSNNDAIANLPVIIMTGAEDSESTKQTVFDAGATDFISKPFESIDLVSRAKAFARLNRQVVELEKKSAHDKLTGLFNAESLEEQGVKAYAFAKRHKLFISTVYFEIKDFQNLFLSYGKSVVQHIILAVGKRLQNAMREEDVAARIGVAKYALILPMTNKQKTEIVIERVCQSINKLVFDTGKEKIRINFVAGYTSPDLSDELEFSDMLVRADDALQRAMSSEVASVLCFEQPAKVEERVEVEEPEVIITEKDIEQAFAKILAGDYHQVPAQHLAVVAERLSPFMQYVENQREPRQLSDVVRK